MVIDSDSLRDLLNHFLLINIFTPAWLTVVFLTKYISWQRSETCQLGFVRDITVAPSLYLATHVTHVTPHIQS